MIKHFFFVLLFLGSLQSFSQKLIYKSNGNILNSENQKISPDQVRELLANNEKLLAEYNAGRSKKTFGNVLLIGGFGLIAADLISGATSDGNATVSGNGYSIQSERNYPTALTYIGVAAVVIAIPIKIGFSKKIRNVVSEYNNLTTIVYNQFNKQKLDLITNSNGIGFRLTLN
ncbi:hypothetical protein [Flavobacterium cellulosilyticum]|uniref:Uncharacterized protein n=1 Tax=Flavobacterium cellulosilyticum TaxID=2541731 RepID=A0A4R5C6I2_9FLAO|nr:hypothetical protein [Flavobacterium cellulosilyticum]TDD93670.1 hypothetical protein E0F76_18710 [Flavobacterium cellulosilyticum]